MLDTRAEPRAADYGVSTADAVPALISFFDAAHVCRFANDHHIHWYGRTPEQLVGNHMRDFLGDALYAQRRPYLERVAGGETVSFEADVPHCSGGSREAAIRYVPRIAEGEFEGFHILVFDLSREQNRFRSVFDGTIVGFVEIDLRGVRRVMAELESEVGDVAAHIASDITVVRRVLDRTPIVGLNEKACQMLGVVPTEAVGNPLGMWCPDETMAVWNRVFLDYIARKVSHEAETVIRRKDGSNLDVILSAAYPKRPEEQVFVVVGLVDISERIAREKALARAQLDLAHAGRVSILGELAASITHEINQPLSAIMTNGHAALRWLNRPVADLDEARVAIGHMILEGERASRIIARTRAMAMKGSGERTVFELKPTLAEAIEITRRQIGILGASCTLAGGDAPIRILGDRVQLQQVIINLIVNAAQAMSEGGSQKRVVEVEFQADGQRAIIRVVDTGPGLDAVAAARLFEAFFTTKADGMGMGLSVSKGIVEAHGGTIVACNNAGPGCTFTIDIPIATADERDLYDGSATLRLA
ncbi:PAS domain S-box-containing protein [Novosphingobium sp. PhB165]|uniref:PAS domain-containing sensor histidine kinase n=1 Tax=Novosphingobium sp. PhB165 TaxID=2485105 RepID=UPI0010E9E340|nr:ATP-binding protein [Novosphingobium sp. PhB165]TCM16549.1 PAS domain S-box-containing protein [Novosphingobium sp. PhB165]